MASEKQHPAGMRTRTKLALWLLISPTALIIAVIFAFAIMNMVFNPTMWPTPDTEMFAPTPIGITIANVVLFIAGAAAIISWLPGIITGIVLLTTKPAEK